MPGPPPKDPERRARRNVDANAVAVVEAVAEPPAPPHGLKWRVLDQWHGFWASPLARIVTATDVPALQRLFELRQRADDLLALAELEPLVEGSQGQLVANPLFKEAKSLLVPVRDLEDRFGLNPKARLGIGVRIGQVADAAERHPEAFGSPQEGRRPRADPRLADTP